MMTILCSLSVRVALILSLSLPWPALATETSNVVLTLPQTGIVPRELAIVVNEEDPLSIKAGEYYRQKRNIPQENLIRLRFPAQGNVLPRARFETLKAELEKLTPAHIQAYALAWTQPYRVDCMSITSAIALGFDEAYCSSSQCASTKPSAYYNSPSLAPYSDHKIRPAMLLAGRTFKEVKELILRGLASDSTYPIETGYLLDTSDKARRVRSVLYEESMNTLGQAFHIQRINANSIQNKKDVLFYFTGLTHVPDLPSLRFLPGAIADHLTSHGGTLIGSSQMSSLSWLEAGATGSYGTVVEPCNHVPKFPHPGIALWHYALGESLLEAYWKSVAWPGEGLFIGEPLAKPFAPKIVGMNHERALVHIFAPASKTVFLEASEAAIGPYHTITSYQLNPGRNLLQIPLPKTAHMLRLAFKPHHEITHSHVTRNADEHRF